MNYYDIGWFIFNYTNIGEIYQKHNNEILSWREISQKFKYVVSAKLIKIIPKSPEYDMNDRIIIEVYLPDIKINDRAFEINRCGEIKKDVYHIMIPLSWC
jgi:hypothetical protein